MDSQNAEEEIPARLRQVGKSLGHAYIHDGAFSAREAALDLWRATARDDCDDMARGRGIVGSPATATRDSVIANSM
ncbi:MAG: hypothetical protein HZA53_15835 [Planctomycetes bacterium]|nr:hypothetical protein [Planctomycetota bacterium]